MSNYFDITIVDMVRAATLHFTVSGDTYLQQLLKTICLQRNYKVDSTALMTEDGVILYMTASTTVTSIMTSIGQSVTLLLLLVQIQAAPAA